MIRALPILLAIFSASAIAKEIYREVDDEGVPTFSDHQQPGSEKVDVKTPVTFSDPVVKDKMKKSSDDKSAVEKSVEYDLVITEPSSDSAIRDNAGNLKLTVSIKPSLTGSHKAELMMNGLMIRRLSNSGPVSLSNVDRGTHKFNIRVINAAGDVVSEGPSISITMLRFSKLHRAN